MNWIDLVIIGAVGLLALLGLRSGILAPAFGVGGLVVGIALALQYHSQLAAGLEELIDEPVARAAAAFIAIVLGTAVASRLAASLVRKLLAYLVLGWLDHVAGAAAGAAIAVVLLGTLASGLTSVDIAPLNQPLRDSSLVTPISRASLLSASDQVCAELMRTAPYVVADTEEDSFGPESVAASSEECADLRSLVLDKVSGLLGDDGETLGQLLKAGLADQPQDTVDQAPDSE